MNQSELDYLYDAFISYRRSDGAAIAAWLRRRLQDYTLPSKIAAGRNKLRVYLDTAFERANEDFWANNIEPALRASRYLVVVATPDTLRPRADGEQNWVERGIIHWVVFMACGSKVCKSFCTMAKTWGSVPSRDLRTQKPPASSARYSSSFLTVAR
jgi:hypothetical protein